MMFPQALSPRVRNCVAALTLIALCSCSQSSAPPPEPQPDSDVPSLVAKRARFRFTVCFPSESETYLASSLDALVKTASQPIQRVPTIDGTESGIILAADLDAFDPEPIVNDVAADSRTVDYLSPEDRKRLAEIDAECVLDWSAPGSDPCPGLLQAVELTQQLAVALHGIVRDDTTGQYYSADQWAELRSGNWHEGTPNVVRQIVIQVSNGAEGLLRAHTRGMTKFALPDVVVGEFPTSELRSIGNTLHVISQAMIEGLITSADGEFDVDMRTLRHPAVRDPQVNSLEAGATGVLLINLRTNRGHGPRTSVLTFDRGAGPDGVSRLTDVLSRAFGVRDAAARTVHTAEVLAASAAARAQLPALRAEFAAGLSTGELLLVKAPFTTPDDGNEYMWVEVTAWTDGTITGHLMNEPRSVPDLQAGQRVEVQESAVFDYLRQHADGSTVGNTTAELLQGATSGQSEE